MSGDDLDGVRQDLARWAAVNEEEALRLELARRGVEVEPSPPSPVDEEFAEVAEELKRRLEAADPMRMVASAIGALAEAVGEMAGLMAASVAAMTNRPSGATVKTIERDKGGNMVRILEEPA